jgi:NHS family xanthosine MFS transporter
MWITNLTGSKTNGTQFLIGGIAAIALGFYSFTLPKCPPQRTIQQGASLMEMLGLNAFKLLGKYKMALFFLFSMFLGAALQLTNMYGDTFLDDFKLVPAYGPDSFVVKYSTIIMSISQISETVFILTIPFFLKRFGIKNVMLFSMFAWVLRFGLFAYGNPGDGLWMIIMSCIVYGMAFDFFNISGSLFVETTTSPEIRSSAQGIFMMITNGVGAFLGSMVSGFLIDKHYTHQFTSVSELTSYLKADTNNSVVQKILEGNTITGDALQNAVMIKDWPAIWQLFAIYSLVIAILFAFMFKHKHDPNEIGAGMH